MAKFLIDVNLPYYFGLWNTPDYIHQSDLDPLMKDQDIWNYAKNEQLTIISKDSDFSNRIIFLNPPPKVIHIKLGNMSMSDFHRIINNCWNQVLDMNKTYKLVNVYRDKLDGIL